MQSRSTRQTVVAALGGNALIQRGQSAEIEVQRRNVALAAVPLAEIAKRNNLVITHGNGPQVGLLALQSAASTDTPAYPLDVLGAESEGMIGYLIEQELANRLAGYEVVTLLTRVVVSADDPAMDNPTKPIGPVYNESEARKLAAQYGWVVAPEGNRYRRVVPSPEPIQILEKKSIQLLVASGTVVICSGGGGIPVIATPAGEFKGIEAVIDKDLSAALLACELGASALLLLTDVPAVYDAWGQPGARKIHRASPTALRAYGFDVGSMGPKVEAAARFVLKTGGMAGIGRLKDAADILSGNVGTLVTPDSEGITFHADSP